MWSVPWSISSFPRRVLQTRVTSDVPRSRDYKEPGLRTGKQQRHRENLVESNLLYRLDVGAWWNGAWKQREGNGHHMQGKHDRAGGLCFPGLDFGYWAAPAAQAG